MNPILYRGYYYDYETGYYYLQSRYYDPSICRFINADIPEIAQQEKDEINGLNLFAYCCNDPVNNEDPTGYKYSPSKAKKYAERWWYDRNKKYRKFDSDCANFVSQCLFAGGLSMNEEWHSYKSHFYKKGYKLGKDLNWWNISKSWSIARYLRVYLTSNKARDNFSYWKIDNKSTEKEFNNVLEKVYKREICSAVIVFYWTERKNGCTVNHFHAMISGKAIYNKKSKKYDAYYYAHTSNRNGKEEYYDKKEKRNKKNPTIRDFWDKTKGKKAIYFFITR